MSTNYLVYPSKYLRLTGAYAQKEYIYCPCDEMVITSICESGFKSVRTIWLQSNSKVVFADGTQDYFSMLIIHLDNTAIQDLHKGQIFKRGEKICLESDDACSSNLFHFAFCKGSVSLADVSPSVEKKANTTRQIAKPEDFFFIDSSFTKICATPQQSFKFLSDVNHKQKRKLSKYEVTASILNVRSGPSTNYPRKTFDELSQSAQNQIFQLSGFKANGYVKGLIFTALQIQRNWAKTPSGWVQLDYCKPI